MASRSWSSSLIWGRTHNTATQHNLNSYLAESVLPLSTRDLITGRFELVDKDELRQRHHRRIGAYTLGYTRDVHLLAHVATGIGANFTAYSLPASLKFYYGDHPLGGNIFVRFRLQ